VFAGQVIVGASLSLTVTEKEQLALPQVLVAVIATLVVPLLKEEPLPVPLPLAVVAPLNVYVVVVALVAIAVYDTAAVHKPEAVLVVMLEGQVVKAGALFKIRVHVPVAESPPSAHLTEITNDPAPAEDDIVSVKVLEGNAVLPP